MRLSTCLLLLLLWLLLYLTFIFTAGAPGVPEIVLFNLGIVAIVLLFFGSRLRQERRKRQ